MDGLRCRTSVRLTGGGVLVRQEWLAVEDNRPGEVQAVEEFLLPPGKQDWSYVSRAAFPDGGSFLPATFFLDPAGNRHFHLQAEAGEVGLFGRGAPAG